MRGSEIGEDLVMAAIHQTRLDGRVAIVTGSGQNIGAAIARRLAEAGAAVVVNGHASAEKVDRTVGEIRAAGGRAVGVMADVSDPKDVERLVAEANAAFGPVDIAVSNVGRRLHKPFETITIEDWDGAIRTNLSSCFYLAHHVVPAMKDRGWGRIVHVSGYDGFTGHLVNRAYNIAAKAGMHGFSKALARELGPFGVTANTLVPGAIDTERDWSQYPTATREAVARTIPVRRWGHVDDLAYACLYLCTTGSFVNGQAIHLNGGEHMF
jgi:NAD(P)-dependent dehydrogenase (short-subunit alcohol dehydrogenase family)